MSALTPGAPIGSNVEKRKPVDDKTPHCADADHA
jgi:hypothetical protein